MKLEADKIVNWIKSYAKKHQIESLIVGISGGIDSALVSTLCGMTGMKTIVVSLPIKQQVDQLNRAVIHSEWLRNNFSNISYFSIDLTSTFNVFESTMSNYNLSTDLSLANSRSRLRMLSLYQIASIHNGIVVGTGNKVEDFGIGFFTKYGDGGVDISPIANLTKSNVKEMAKSLGIIDSILEAKPTDGLWEDDRSDEDQIGATYNEIEWAMEYISNNPNYSLLDLDKLTIRECEVLLIYKNLHNKNLHKMQAIPVYRI